jgi:hypothetical protein
MKAKTQRDQAVKAIGRLKLLNDDALDELCRALFSVSDGSIKGAERAKMRRVYDSAMSFNARRKRARGF